LPGTGLNVSLMLLAALGLLLTGGLLVFGSHRLSRHRTH
jgi:hypothetical protein